MLFAETGERPCLAGVRPAPSSNRDSERHGNFSEQTVDEANEDLPSATQRQVTPRHARQRVFVCVGQLENEVDDVCSVPIGLATGTNEGRRRFASLLQLLSVLSLPEIEREVRP